MHLSGDGGSAVCIFWSQSLDSTSDSDHQPPSADYVPSTPRLEQIDPGDSEKKFVWDSTNNVTYSYWKHKSYENLCPCLLRGHRYWLVGKQRWGLSPGKVSSLSFIEFTISHCQYITSQTTGAFFELYY